MNSLQIKAESFRLPWIFASWCPWHMARCHADHAVRARDSPTNWDPAVPKAEKNKQAFGPIRGGFLD